MIHILLIEDDMGDVILFNEYIKQDKDKYTVSYCLSLHSAIEKLNKSRFDIIVLDLNLPDCSGLNTLYKIQNVSGEIPIIVFSIGEDEKLFDEVAKSGAQDFLIKGRYSGEQIIRSIRFAIERNKKLSLN